MKNMSLVKPLQIYYVTNKETDMEFLNSHTKVLVEYFKIDTHFLPIEEVNVLFREEKEVDFLFIYENNLKFNAFNILNQEYRNRVDQNNPNFKLIWILNDFKESDFDFFKNGADDVFYLNKKVDFFRWKAIILLRRMWEPVSNGNIVFHRGITIDIPKKIAIFNSSPLYLTKKEFGILSFLIHNKDKGILSKDKIFQAVWKIEDKDVTRVVDQILLKLRKKIGKKYFESNFKEGVRLV